MSFSRLGHAPAAKTKKKTLGAKTLGIFLFPYFWAPLGPPRAPLGSLWVPFGSPWRPLAPLGAPEGHLGSKIDGLSNPDVFLGSSLVTLHAPWAPSRCFCSTLDVLGECFRTLWDDCTLSSLA